MLPFLLLASAAHAADPIVELSGTATFSCARHASGRVSCRGDNRQGQLGDGSLLSRDEPRYVDGLDEIVSIGTSADRACAVSAAGEVRCWGAFARVPFRVVGVTDAKEVRVHPELACAIRGGGRVRCWGDVSLLPPVGNSGSWAGDPVDVPLLSGATALGFWGRTVCAIRADAHVRCVIREHLRAVPVGGPEPIDIESPPVTAFAGSGEVGCIVAARELRCWGRVASLGIDRVEGATDVPQLVGEIDKVDELRATSDSVCARRGSDVRCWDRDALAPEGTAPVGTGGAVALGEGCAALADGRLRCWGSRQQQVPAEVTGLEDVVQVVAGGASACALQADGEVRCWGQIGGGYPVRVSTPERPVELGMDGRGIPCMRAADGRTWCRVRLDRWESTVLPEVTEMVVGDGQICGIRDGRAQCAKHRGGTLMEAPVGGISALAVSRDHSCAIHDGELSCWGKNWDGRLGDGTRKSSTQPVPVGIEKRVAEVGVGASYTCARLIDGEVRCAGAFVHLGGGRGPEIYRPAWPGTLNSAVPVPVVGITDATALTAARLYACAIVEGGAVTCWGHRPVAADGERWLSLKPARVPDLTDAVEVAGGEGFACARTDAGRVRCWGRDTSGQLGAGDVRTGYDVAGSP